MHVAGALVVAIAIWIIGIAIGLADMSWWTPYLVYSAPLVISGLIVVVLFLAELAAYLRGKR